jgi:hypothetical protein
MFTRFAIAATAAFTAFAAAPSQATVLFADNFDGDTAALVVTSLPNWTVAGDVDLVAHVNPYGIANCDGICVDLDGTPGPGTITTRSIDFLAGRAVTVSFDLSGNERGGADDVFIASVAFNPANGGSAAGISGPPAFVFPGVVDMLNGTPYVETIGSDRGFLTYSYTFTANTSGAFTMSFGTTSSDNVGPILDNVLVTENDLKSAVPEPASWALMVAGFGMVGFAMRRRSAIVTA